MRKHRGQHFDPTLLDTFFNSMDDILRIQKDYPDLTGGGQVQFNESPL